MCATCGRNPRTRWGMDCRRCAKLRKEITRTKVKLGKIQRRFDKRQRRV